MADQVVLCPFLGVVLDKLGSLIQTELGPLRGVKKEMKRLYKTLCKIKDVLSDAEEKQFKEATIRIWLQELNDAAYEADDVLDVFAFEGLHLASERSSSLKETNFQQKIRKDTEKLIDMFHEFVEESSMLNLQKGSVEKRVEIYPGRETSSVSTEQQIYGRDEDREKLVKLLLRPGYLQSHQYHANHSHPRGVTGRPLLNYVHNTQEDISVCPIVGIGGVGKTTLAQLVYNDDRVAKNFDVRSWVCVSNNFDTRRFIKAILSSLSSDTCAFEELEPLQRHLQQELHGKTFLLVLDDVWEESQQEWNKLKGSLRCGASGSSVIVTTRLQTVASITGTLPPHHLKGLSKDGCWALFKQCAFGLGNEERPALVEIGKEIVDKCGGVPLAAKALGSLLRFKNEENEWMSVKESKIWELPQSGENDILPALRLSYDHLPSHLKPCFVYCSIFPKDLEIRKEEIIQLWMANGLLQSHARMELEDVGNEIFKALLWRSFFEDIKRDKDGNIRTFKMHELVHDLACYIAKDEYFVVDVGSARYITEKTRHVLLSGTEAQLSSICESIQRSSPGLRSLILLNFRLNLENYMWIFSNLADLRALDLGGVLNDEVVPDSIGKMIHLRYLNLSGTAIRYLPESICLLRNVQTLNLRWCSKLESLPKDMRNMSSLRYLDIRDCDKLTGMPIGMRQLTCLQTLSIFIVGMESGCGVDELQGLNLGGKLEIKALEHVRSPMEAKASNLMRKKNLRSLWLTWSDFELQEQQNATGVIEALQPHSNIRQLVVEGYGGLTCPSWLTVSLVPNLVRIRLEKCTGCERLPPLGKLPLLKVLCLREMDSLKFIDDGDYGECVPVVTGFPSLEALLLYYMPNLEGWASSLSYQRGGGDQATATQKQMFPCLKSVSVIDCPRLTSIPLSWSPVQSVLVSKCNEMVLGSLQNLPCLTSLEIMTIDELEYFPQGTLRNLPVLHELKITWCDNLKALPVELESLTKLTELKIYSCSKLVSLAEGQQGLRNLSSLKTLGITDCHVLKRLPELENRSLLHLHIFGCRELEFSKENFEHLVALEDLRLSGLPKLKCFPEGIKDAVMLQHLEILHCSEDVMDLPDWIGVLMLLNRLHIHGCKERRVLPEGMQYLTALRKLRILGCNEELERRYDTDKGEDWFKISHIPDVQIRREMWREWCSVPLHSYFINPSFCSLFAISLLLVKVNPNVIYDMVLVKIANA